MTDKPEQRLSELSEAEFTEHLRRLSRMSPADWTSLLWIEQRPKRTWARRHAFLLVVVVGLLIGAAFLLLFLAR